MGQNPHDTSHGPGPLNPNYPPQPVQPGPMASPPPLRPDASYTPPAAIPPTQTRANQTPLPQSYPGYQQNLAAAQGYPGYQRPFDALAPAVPEIQITGFAGYHEQAVAPIILPPPQPPQPPQPLRIGRIILIVFIVLLLIAVGGTGYIFYTNHQNTIHAQATATAHASITAHLQATATAIASIYPFSKHLVLHDSLANASHTAQYGWTNNTPGCFFARNAYHVFARSTTPSAICAAEKASFYNFTFQIQMTFERGNASSTGGLIFRALAYAHAFYFFSVDTQGNYQLGLSSNTNLANERVFQSGQIATFVPGLNRKNTLSIVARGKQISVYSNQKLITQIADATYINGQIGMFGSSSTGSTDIAYTNAQVWQI